MKKYIETKQIEAEPMTLGDFVQETGRNPYGKDIENHKETEKGYRVKYEDGYESWSPAKAFEKSYKCADTFLDRLHIEMKDLYDRLDKLVAFIDSGKMDEVVTDNYQKFLLRLQQVVMGNYVKTLECRIGCLDGAPNGKVVDKVLVAGSDTVSFVKNLAHKSITPFWVRKKQSILRLTALYRNYS